MVIGIFYLVCSYFMSTDNLSLDSTLNYDPVKEAAAQNFSKGLTSGDPTGNDPQRPEYQQNVPNLGNIVIKDTQQLGNWLMSCGRGTSFFNCSLESDEPNELPAQADLGRIWAHVKAEHPEFVTNPFFGSKDRGVNDVLIGQIYKLNKNYPKEWP